MHGPTAARALATRFGSLQAVRDADEAIDVCIVAGDRVRVARVQVRDRAGERRRERVVAPAVAVACAAEDQV